MLLSIKHALWEETRSASDHVFASPPAVFGSSTSPSACRIHSFQKASYSCCPGKNDEPLSAYKAHARPPILVCKLLARLCQSAFPSHRQDVTWCMGPLVRKHSTTFGMPRDSAHMSCHCESRRLWYNGSPSGCHLGRDCTGAIPSLSSGCAFRVCKCAEIHV